jgi:YHS domain-containing protein
MAAVLSHFMTSRQVNVFHRGEAMITIQCKKTKRVAMAALAAASLVLWAMPAAAIDPVNTNSFGVAIRGYDTVAYHTQGRAVKGSKAYSHHWNDAEWYFASADNRDRFAADPERYVPQYGGY